MRIVSYFRIQRVVGRCEANEEITEITLVSSFAFAHEGA